MMTRSIAPRNLNGKPDGACVEMCAEKPEHPNNKKNQDIDKNLAVSARTIFRKHRGQVGRREDYRIGLW